MTHYFFIHFFLTCPYKRQNPQCRDNYSNLNFLTPRPSTLPQSELCCTHSLLILHSLSPHSVLSPSTLGTHSLHNLSSLLHTLSLLPPHPVLTPLHPVLTSPHPVLTPPHPVLTPLHPVLTLHTLSSLLCTLSSILRTLTLLPPH